MALLVSLHDVSKSYGSQKLFEKISFALNEGDRMGIGGPNGAGKSTLLKIIYGMECLDEGRVAKKQGIKISYASQAPEFVEKNIIDVLIEEIPQISKEESEVKARILLDKAGFSDCSVKASSLSGGWKKRLDIVRAWMKDPDLVLLDEPTNHLDLEGIEWLEQFLKKERTAFLVISHDRYFLENVCTKVAEINQCFPQGIFVSEGNWSTFIERKEIFLKGQQEQQRSLAGVVKDEIEWLRKSPKARTTKSKSRIQKTYDLMDELSLIKQRNTFQKASIDFSASERETRNLLVATNLSKSLGEKVLFKGIDLKLSPGTRLGIVGKNGTGKTTLLKVLAGHISPDLGTIKYAQDLKLVYFDQHREALDLNLSLREALSPRGDFVEFRGQDIHVNGWARKFLFSPDRLNLPLSCLSGGERARILIARLMLEPADILFLDEPTNDLDIPTLEVIENSLLEFPGAVVLITHDRFLMDKVCSQVLGLGEACQERLFADFSQWEKAVKDSCQEKTIEVKTFIPPPPRSKKLSYKEQKELEGMEETISSVEKILAELHEESAQTDSKKGITVYEKMAETQKKLEDLYERWQFLLNQSK